MIDRCSRVLLTMILGGTTALTTSLTLAGSATYSNILGGDGTYVDTGITVNPFAGDGSPGIFGPTSGCCIGVQGGTNNGAVDDVDGVLGGSDSERMEFVLDSGFGLTSVDFIFTRANPVILSGFINDPQASVDAAAATAGVVPIYDNGTLTFSHPWRGGAVTDLVFGNPGASSGQTITLRVGDAAAGPQAAVFGFDWDLASPTYPGDVDGDLDVDLTDFGFIRDNWFNSSSPTRAMGDLNGDGIVEFDDFAEWKAAFPFPLGGSFEAGFYVVPEAASITLLAVALVGMGMRRPKRVQMSSNSSGESQTIKGRDQGDRQLGGQGTILASLVGAVMMTSIATAQLSIDFENPPYVAGTLQNQQGWTGGQNFPRVQTASQISAELVAAGLNAGTTAQSGSQALLVTANPGETTQGGLVGKAFTGLANEPLVSMEWWARPLTAGSAGSTIGTELGNTFVGLRDTAGNRAAALRFGVVRDESNAITGTTIDYGSASAGSAVWVPSGLTWAADTWYNFRFDLNYVTKEYDFFVNDSKVNSSPIQFYNTASAAAANVFVSRGPINAGQILDDFNIDQDFSKKLLLTIDPTDGDGVVTNNTTAAVSLDSYTIASATNSLLTGWGSLADQSTPGWEEATPNAGRVSELNPTGTITLNPGQSFTLAGLWNTLGPQNITDLTFQYRDASLEATLNGVVEFASAGIPGDFDNDGDVDGRDFLTWQRNPSVGSLADWQNNYGTSGLSAVAAAVPEPSSVLLIVCGLACVSGRRLF